MADEEKPTGPVISEDFESKVNQGLARKDEQNTVEPYVEQAQQVTADNDARKWLQKGRQSMTTLLGTEQTRDDERREEIQRLNSEAQPVQQRPQPNRSNQDLEASDDEQTFKPVVPERVSKSYVEMEGKYYFASRPESLAFVDKGARLQTKLSNAQVAGSMVDIAEARGWTEIQLKGTPEFRREAWIEASIRGLSVRGYNAKEEDLVVAKHRASKRQANEIESQDKPEPNPARETQPSSPREASQESQASAAPGQDQGPSPAAPKPQEKTQESEPVNRLAGTIVEHGKAPYENKPDNRDSYYVTLENDDGKKSTTWGVDLERALSESQAKEGDRVELENQGQQAVTVERPVKDEMGNVVRNDHINTHRNTWAVKAEAVQDRERNPKDLVRDHPDLVNEVAAIKVAEKFSQQQFNNDDDRGRFMEKVRTQIAGNLSQAKSAPEVKLREERVIERPDKESNRER